MGKGTDRFWWMMCLAWAALAAGPVGVQGQELAGPGMTEGPSSRAPIGTGTVLRVNDDAITSPEILKTLRGQLAEWAGKMDARQFAAQAKKALAQAVINEVQNRLLYQYANEVLEDSGNFEEVLKKEMADRRGELLGRFGGSEAEAHAQLQAVGSSVDRELESVERQMVISIYRDTYIRPAVEITRSQMMRYYSRHREALYHVEPTIQFQLIDVPAEAFAEGAAGAEAGLAEARRQAEAALQEIEDGKDFGQVVLRYSHGFYKDQEGLWRPMNPGSLSERYEPVVKALEVLEAGQHSGVVAGEDRFFIAKLVNRQVERFVPFAEVQDEIAERLFSQRWQKDSAVLLERLLTHATVGDTPKFVNDLTVLACEEYLPVMQEQTSN